MRQKTVENPTIEIDRPFGIQLVGRFRADAELLRIFKSRGFRLQIDAQLTSVGFRVGLG